MKQILNLEQTFNFLINTYPLLYASNSIEISKYKVYDQLFNTIGNGYGDLKTLTNKLSINKKTIDLINDFPIKYINQEDLYSGYTKFRDAEFELVDFNSMLNELFTEKEKITQNDVVKFIKVKKHDAIPYPNFKKEYSMVWKIDMHKLDPSWIEGAIWFYKESKEFFNSEKASQYHYAWPSDVKKQEKLIENYENSFNRLKKDGQTEQEFFDEISKAYEVIYSGNTRDFIKNRWSNDLNQIKAFIDETLEKLENDLIKHPNYLSKRRNKP